MFRFYTLIIIAGLLFFQSGKLNCRPTVNQDSIAIQHWVKPIVDSIFIHPAAILPWLDSLSNYADAAQSFYANYRASNFKGNYFWAINRFDSAIIYFHKGGNWAKQGGYLQYEINALANVALVYNLLNNADSASFYYLKAIEMAKKYHLTAAYTENVIRYSSVLSNYGAYYEAVTLLVEAARSDEIQRNPALNASLHAEMGNVFYLLGNLEQMHTNYHKAIAFHLKQENYPLLTTLYINMAESFTSLESNYDSAFYYYTKALGLNIPRNREAIMQMIDMMKGRLFLDEAKYDSAIMMYQQALYQYQSQHNPKMNAALSINMGLAYYGRNDMIKARQYLLEGYKLADSFHFLEYKKNAVWGLIRIDSAEGRFRDAFMRAHTFDQLQKELNASDAKNKLISLEVEKELELQKLRNEVLENQNSYNYQRIRSQRKFNLLVVIVLAGSLIFTWVQYRNLKKIRRLNELLNLNIQKLDRQNIELEGLNQTKDKFLSIIAHDLRSPFNSIIGFSELLADQIKSKDYDGIDEYAEIIRKSSHLAMDLLTNLLEWSRMQTGRMAFKPESVDLGDLISGALNLLENNAVQKSITIKVNTPPGLTVFADPPMINTVLRNLISNAVKFTNHGGEVIVSVEKAPEEVIVSVKDNGVGISPHRIDKLFSIDTTESTTGTNNEQGTGLGLILCKEFVEKHGGNIWVESLKGKGSAFYLTLPV